MTLCEGESDAQTFWFHGMQALGVPGAASWQAEWAEYVKDLTVYVWQEPDQGGETFSARVGASLPDCRILTPPDGRKDISECHIAVCASADGVEPSVPELIEKLRVAARPWREIAAYRSSRLPKPLALTNQRRCAGCAWPSKTVTSSTSRNARGDRRASPWEIHCRKNARFCPVRTRWPQGGGV